MSLDGVHSGIVDAGGTPRRFLIRNDANLAKIRDPRSRLDPVYQFFSPRKQRTKYTSKAKCEQCSKEVDARPDRLHKHLLLECTGVCITDVVIVSELAFGAFIGLKLIGFVILDCVAERELLLKALGLTYEEVAGMRRSNVPIPEHVLSSVFMAERNQCNLTSSVPSSSNYGIVVAFIHTTNLIRANQSFVD